MVNQPTAEDRLIDRRTLLQTGAALAAAGPALLHGAHAKAQLRPSGASPITIIDAQVHAYAANTPERPWNSVPNWPPHVTGDEMVAAMNKVGVDGAIYISPFSMYQYDASYAVGVQRAHPDKFALVKPVNPDDPAVADVIADWKKTPGTVGIRIIMTRESKRAPDDPGFDRILRAAVRIAGSQGQRFFLQVTLQSQYSWHLTPFYNGQWRYTYDASIFHSWLFGAGIIL